MKTIPGFDYVTLKPVKLTRREWREKYAGLAVEQRDGETFVWGKPLKWQGLVRRNLVAEIYEQGVLK